MTKTALANKDLDLKRKMHDTDVAEKGKDRKANLDAAKINAIGNMSGRVLGGLINDPDFYLRIPGGDDKSIFGIPQLKRNSVYLDNVYIPSVFVFPYVNTFGSVLKGDETTLPIREMAINQSSQKFKAILRSMNSRIGQYEPGDLMQRYIACVSCVEECLRLRRALSHHDDYNLNHPDFARLLIEGDGYDYDNFIEHVADYRVFLNANMIKLINENLFIPTGFSYLDRKIALIQNTFLDGNGKNQAVFMFTPARVLRYSEETAILVAVAIPTTYALVTANWSAMTNDLLHGEFADDMLADLENPRVGISAFKMPYLEGTEPTKFIKDEYIRHQVMNATIAAVLPGEFGSTGKTEIQGSAFFSAGYLKAYNLVQDSQGLLVPTCDTNASPAVDATGFQIIKGVQGIGGQVTVETLTAKLKKYCDVVNTPVLNFYSDKNVSGEDIIESTRLKFWVKGGVSQVTDSGATVSIEAKIMGTEIVPFALVSSTATTGKYMEVDQTLYAYGGNGYGTSELKTRASVDTLQCKPIFVYDNFTYLAGPDTIFPVYSDFDVYAFSNWYHVVPIKEESIADMHTVAVLSEFYLSNKSTKTNFAKESKSSGYKNRRR